jgi:hypothetical protein
MAEISRRRPDQLGYLMTVLELGAINLDNRASILEQRLRCRFDGTGPTRPHGVEKEKVANRAAGSNHAAEIQLINADNLPNCFLLSDDALA